jgi:hypothetical protein
MTSATKNGHTRCPATSSLIPKAEEVAMSASVTTIDRLDCEIAVAAIALGVARGSFDRCPSAENAAAVSAAERSVDRLLDQRFVAQQ